MLCLAPRVAGVGCRPVFHSQAKAGCPQLGWVVVGQASYRNRKTGLQRCPYPVDYRSGHATTLTEYALVDSLQRWQTALHEWLGLWVYGVTR